jgi:hypothetical protein
VFLKVVEELTVLSKLFALVQGVRLVVYVYIQKQCGEWESREEKKS